MTIADALRTAAPPAAAATDEERERRQAALACLYEALHRLARRICSPGALAEDVASTVLCHLMDTGPREASTAPANDAAALRYLAKSVHNRLVDHHRSGQRVCGDEDLDRFAGPVPDLPDADEDHRLALLREAGRVLYDEAVPAIARTTTGKFDRDAFVATVAQMRAIHQGSLTVEAVLTEADGGVTTAGRNRLYKQHERTRTRLFAALPPWLADRALPADLDTTVRGLAVFELAPRVTREETR